MSKEILAATTDAANSDPFYVHKDEVATVMCSPDLSAGETADIQLTQDNGANEESATWVDYQYDGSAVELTETQNAIRLYGPMWYRVAKDATSGATGLYLLKDQDQ